MPTPTTLRALYNQAPATFSSKRAHHLDSFHLSRLPKKAELLHITPGETHQVAKNSRVDILSTQDKVFSYTTRSKAEIHGPALVRITPDTRFCDTPYILVVLQEVHRVIRPTLGGVFLGCLAFVLLAMLLTGDVAGLLTAYILACAFMGGILYTAMTGVIAMYMQARAHHTTIAPHPLANGASNTGPGHQASDMAPHAEEHATAPAPSA